MSAPRLTRLELRIMDALWEGGPVSIREIQERWIARYAESTLAAMVGLRRAVESPTPSRTA